MRQLIGIAALVALGVLVGCGAPGGAGSVSGGRPAPSVSSSPVVPSSSSAPTSSPVVPDPTRTASPVAQAAWSLLLNDSGPCSGSAGDDCVSAPSLARAPKLGNSAAVLRMRGLWQGDLAVPRSLGSTHVACQAIEDATYPVDSWTYVLVTDPTNESSYGLAKGSAHFELTVTDNGRIGNFGAEAVLSFDHGGQHLEVTDSTGTIMDGAPALMWSWSDDRRTVRFSFRAPSVPSSWTGPSELIGSTLVSGAIRCPQHR